MDVVFLVGRILFGLRFVRSGVGHLVNRDAMVDYAEGTRGLPPRLMVPLAVVMVLEGVSVIFGIWADLGALLIVAFIIPTAVIVHDYWTVEDPRMQQIERSQFMKNLSMAGGALIIFYLYNQGQDLPLSLTDALLGPWG